MDGAQGSSARFGRRCVRPHLPGTALEREFCDRNQHSLLNPHRATLQVYLLYFVTDNFITSQRLDAALQHHTLHVMAGLPPALQPWVHE